MNFLIDTSAYSAAQRDNQKIIDYFNEADHIFLPSIVEGELRVGFAYGSKKVENNELLNKFMNQNSVSVVNLSELTPAVFAEIYAELRTAGTPIGQNDLWIAALAREHSLPVLTLDKDFNYVKSIELVSV